jgi:hypothetical protein
VKELPYIINKLKLIIGVFVGFSSIFLLGILIFKGTLRDVFISRSVLKGESSAVIMALCISVSD